MNAEPYTDKEAQLVLPATAEELDAHEIMDIALSTVSENSARVYAQTYIHWMDWGQPLGVHPLDLRPQIVREFLREMEVTRATRRRHLSALRKLARVLALDPTRPEFRNMYEALRMLKIPEDNLGGTERTRKALRPIEVWKALEVWEGDDPITIRNRALLAVMFYTGMRRSEIIALEWRDIDFEAGIAVVRHGKGDRYREVAIIEGNDDGCLRVLEQWRLVQNAIASGNEPRVYVFCGMRKGNKLREDKPMHRRAVNQIVDQTTKLSGVEFTPHDARRTLGTDLLTGNAPLSDVQAQLGHKNASTTLNHYSMPADARKRRTNFKTSY